MYPTSDTSLLIKGRFTLLNRSFIDNKTGSVVVNVFRTSGLLYSFIVSTVHSLHGIIVGPVLYSQVLRDRHVPYSATILLCALVNNLIQRYAHIVAVEA